MITRKKSRRTCHVRISLLGVDVIDTRGDMLAGITESEALQLHRSLTRNLPRIRARLKKDGR